MQRIHDMPWGAAVDADGTRFRLWAPKASGVELLLETGGEERRTPMQQEADGWWLYQADRPLTGALYRYSIDGGMPVPDPASRFQPDGVHGASQVIDPQAYQWTDLGWHGRPWEETVLYELHVGTFSPEGTFLSAIPYLDHIVALGVTAVEILPVAECPGTRNWGYDGVDLYATEQVYGTPHEFKRLIEECHRRGLSVILDVVYNHFGPEGAYVSQIAPSFFTDKHKTPWGDAISFDQSDSRAVRDFYLHNALYWLEEFDIDGLRLDAIHAIQDDSAEQIIEEICRVARSWAIDQNRPVHLIAENELNGAGFLRRDETGRPVLFDGQWNDDVHHPMHVLATGERDGYYVDYAHDTIEKLGRALAEGFAYQGEPSTLRKGEPRGSSSAHLPPTAFVPFLQNHDQIGNRLHGERIGALADPQALRAMVRILLLQPQPPLLFMGEEWNASTPWPYFCHVNDELAALIRDSRKREYAVGERFNDPAALETVPDPTTEESFLAARLDWDEVARAGHAEWLELYRHLLTVRQHSIVPLLRGLSHGGGTFEVHGHVLRVTWPLAGGRLHLVANCGRGPAPRGEALPGRIIEGADAIEGTTLPGWAVAFAVEHQ